MIYTCRMHPEIRLDAPGKCPKCRGCDLVPLQAPAASGLLQVAPQLGPAPAAVGSEAAGSRQYVPFFTILALILLAALAGELARAGAFSWHAAMNGFMAGFFLVFAGFKLIDLPGFAAGYSSYDLLARRVPAYGYVYPFLELALGLAYLTGFQPVLANWATLLLMVFGSLGVLQVVRAGRNVQCACLGTAIKLPLTTVTLAEDLGMAGMAALSLLL
jgi:hypothetical protein